MADTPTTTPRKVALTVTVRSNEMDVDQARRLADLLRDVVDKFEGVEINVIENKPRESLRG